MKFVVAASKQNTASMNIASFLEGTLPKGMGLHFFDSHICFTDEVNNVEADAIIFASSHKSVMEKPTLTTHAIGNWGKAELGGKAKTLVPTNAFLLKNYLLGLQEQKEKMKLDYEVTLEVTHHGPSLTKPVVFIELGSGEKQWSDKKAAEAVANTILEHTSVKGNFKPAIAFGGGHYCPEFTKLVLRTDYALGHICPLYALPDLNSDLVQQAINATNPKAESIVLDWKGLKAEKQKVSQLSEESGIKVERVRPLLKQ